ncbi:MAG: protein phosphatase 2C domain-containing protein [Bdellovibrionota bacterium]
MAIIYQSIVMLPANKEIVHRIDTTQNTIRVGRFEISYYTRKNPQKASFNEDSLGYVLLDDENIILVVADGVGGQPKGDNASGKVLKSVLDKLANIDSQEKDENTIRNAILNGIESANQDLISEGSGAKTTVTICEIRGNTCRSYQVGDSELLVCGQKGKLKYKTTSHSPVGYGVEAGLITETAALNHPDRHFISNVVGEAEMKIEMGPKIKLAARDTILMGSDGLFDNFSYKELKELVRSGKLNQVLERLDAKLRVKINDSFDNSEKAKYDDVSFLIARQAS